MRVLLLLALTLAIAIVYAEKPSKFSARFKLFKLRNGKVYKDSHEEEIRAVAFEKTLEKVDTINDDYSNNKTTYYADLHEHSDLTRTEFVKQKLGLRLPEEEKSKRDFTGQSSFGGKSIPFKIFTSDRNFAIPTANFRHEWGEPPLNQQTCGSCWAFSTSSVLNAQYYLKNKNTVRLSPQDLVDCAYEYDNHGCNGGFPARAVQYVNDKGIATEAEVPYKNTETSCRTTSSKSAKTYGYGKVTLFKVKNDEKSIIQALLTYGPLLVLVDVEDGFQAYKGGVYDGKYNGRTECTSNVNHAVVLVGFGKDKATGVPYYEIKNSWGTSWGEGGYIRVSRIAKPCGIEEYVYGAILTP